MKLLVILYTIASIFPTDRTIIDLQQISGKTKAEVISVLGPPSRSELHLVEKNCPCERVYYLQGEIYIIYFEGKADLIWASTSKVKIINFENAKVKAYHNNYNWVKIQMINTDIRKCCAEKIG